MTGEPPVADVLVANPSSIPELVAAATGLARARRLHRYCVPLVITPEQESLVGRVLPRPLARRMLRELKRRAIPSAIPENAVARVALTSELLSVAMGRAPISASTKLKVSRGHHALFDRRVAAKLDEPTRAVVTVAGAAAHTLAMAQKRGIAGVLDCPTPHHAYIRALIIEESNRHSAPVARTLVLRDFGAGFCDRLDRELELAQRVLVLSCFQKMTYIQAGVPEEKLILTPLGVDLDLFRPAPRDDDGVFRIIFVGAMTQRKGISYLVEAMRLAAIPEAELLCVGRPVGSENPWAGSGIRYIGPVPRAELPGLYAQADAYVLPSLLEGFPQTALEAMASGLPVIVSDHTFGDDVVTDGVDGYVVPVRDSEAIAERLLALHRDRGLRRRIGDAARLRSESFSWEAYGRRVVDAIDSVA